MSEEDIMYMVCFRVDDNKPHYTNSSITNCDECDARIWVSPASVEQMGVNNAVPICVQCGIKLIPPDAQPTQPTKEQLREVREGLKKLKNENTTKWFGDITHE